MALHPVSSDCNGPSVDVKYCETQLVFSVQDNCNTFTWYNESKFNLKTAGHDLNSVT